MRRLAGTAVLGLLTCASLGVSALACGKGEGETAQADAAAGHAEVDAQLREGPPRVLFFTKETLFFHTDAHRIGDELVPKYLRARGHEVTVTDDAAQFTPENLARFDACLFFVTSGTVFDEAQRAAFEAFIRSGKGFAGVHAASATELESEFFRGLVGGTFAGHGVGDAGITTADLEVVDPSDPLVSFLPRPWARTDEWYFFVTDPAQNPALVQLLRIDEATLPANYPDAGRTGIHPLSWRQEYMGGRSFYTALGHTGASYEEEPFVRSIALGVEWAARAKAP